MKTCPVIPLSLAAVGTIEIEPSARSDIQVTLTDALMSEQRDRARAWNLEFVSSEVVPSFCCRCGNRIRSSQNSMEYTWYSIHWKCQTRRASYIEFMTIVPAIS